ncbi:MAG: NADAR family protein [Bacteroidaceae bacterium]|nr:NADAR family protein [Bacteroidaceae bacterium]
MNYIASNQSTSHSVANLSHQEALDPQSLNLLTYSGPKDTCQGIASGRLGNMAGGFHFNLFGVKWYGTEHLYLCGEWSQEGERSEEIQQYIRKMPSGVYAKRCSKAKYKSEIRADFTDFRYDWMLWCVWQKCLLNSDFASLLRSIPEDSVIVEVVKNDPVWAAYPDAEGIIRGGNAMGKILSICRHCLITATEPSINRQLLNEVGIYILGNRIEF